jgi:hypothetical protein
MTALKQHVGALASGAMLRVHQTPTGGPMAKSRTATLLFPLISSILLTGCDGLQGGAEDAVRSMLKDPESARFGEFYYNSETKLACLAVNAKNSMGGYTGFKQIELRQTENGWEWINEIESTPEDCRERWADNTEIFN